MRKLTLVVSLLVSTAWAQETTLNAEAEPEAPRHALWLHTGFTTQLPGASLGYEHWFNRSISVQLSLGGSYSQSVEPFTLLNADGSILQLGVASHTWAVSTGVQLRWHLAAGVFFSESLALQWQRTTSTNPTSGLGTLGGLGASSDATHFFEAVLVGWGHTFDNGLRFELFAGPIVSLGLSGPSADSMSANAISAGVTAGVGLGYAF